MTFLPTPLQQIMGGKCSGGGRGPWLAIDSKLSLACKACDVESGIYSLLGNHAVTEFLVVLVVILVQ